MILLHIELLRSDRVGIETLDLLRVTSDRFKIQDNLVITSKVRYGDWIWDFTDENNERKNSVNNSKLKFDWIAIFNRVGERFVNDLKVLTFFLIKAPAVFGSNLGKNGNYKVNTVNGMIMKTVDVVEKILVLNQVNLGINSVDSKTSFSHLTHRDFEKIPIPKSSINNMKKILRLLAHPIIQKHLLSNIKWKQSDIGNMSFSIAEKTYIKEQSAEPIDESFFTEISKQFTIDIISFKKMMGKEIYSSIPESYIKEIDKRIKSFNLFQAFEDYVEMRGIERRKAIEHGRRGSWSSGQKKSFKKKYEISVKEFYFYIKSIHMASIFALSLYTGVRYSELISFKKNCIHPYNDIHVIKGTVIKHENDLLPTDCDEWVAIAIVRDAVDILEEMQRISFNTHLVSSLESVYLNRKDVPLSDTAVIDGLNFYVYTSAEINSKLNPFATDKKHKISIHRLRHTLAQQLVRGKLGLPYISYHLKHVNSAVVAYRKVSNVTLGYGGIAREIYQSAKHIHSAKKELYNEIYNPNSPVAGGKNANEFKERRKEYFQGLMVNDEEIEEVIEDLKSQSLPFLDVGLGYCAGRKDLVLKDGTKQPPPCIGQLKCNPVDCGNAIIPVSKLPIWKKVYQDTYEKLQNAEYSYMELELNETLQRAESVINHLNEDEGLNG